MHINDLNNYTNKEIYFGTVLNNNVIDLDIKNKIDNIYSYLSDLKILKKNKCKIYIHNNMFYEVKNKNHSCYKKDNFISREFKTNNKVIKIFAFNKKSLSTEIFPSIQNYLNEEEYEETIYENNIHLRKYKDSIIIYLTKLEKSIINDISSFL
jgi:hypothetical protein